LKTSQEIPVFLKIKQDKEIPDCSSKPHRKTTNLQQKKQTQIKLLKNKKNKNKDEGQGTERRKPHSPPDVHRQGERSLVRS
jgi:hypothetical protein